MITYTAKSSVVTIAPYTSTPVLLVVANKDRTCLKLRAGNASVLFGGSDVSVSNGYREMDGLGRSTPLHFEGESATCAVYCLFSDQGVTSVSILEVSKQ